MDLYSARIHTRTRTNEGPAYSLWLRPLFTNWSEPSLRDKMSLIMSCLRTACMNEPMSDFLLPLNEGALQSVTSHASSLLISLFESIPFLPWWVVCPLRPCWDWSNTPCRLPSTPAARPHPGSYGNKKKHNKTITKKDVIRVIKFMCPAGTLSLLAGDM